MKNEIVHAKKWAALLKRLRHSFKVEPPPQRDPVTQMVVGFLEWNATPKSAKDAHHRISQILVDNNDLRVSHPQEVADLLGPRYPRGAERAARLREALQEVFVREHAVSLESLAGKPKKVVRAYLDAIPGMTPFVAAQVALLNFGAHGIPVDDHLAELLRQEQVVEPGSTAHEIELFLERQVKVGEAVEVHQVLQAWAATHPITPAPAAAKAPAKAPAPPASPAPAAHAKPAAHPPAHKASGKESHGGKAAVAARPAHKAPAKKPSSRR
ncbi:MAG: hypothetical protein NTW19_04705 [Planctomycetota bacterium]|nr:hypothetical protein [Planctomycetota bacterium]